jgi:hypothetical protein
MSIKITNIIVATIVFRDLGVKFSSRTGSNNKLENKKN